MTKTLRTMLSAGLLCAVVSVHAQQPAQNIDPRRHGNLAAAQASIEQAYNDTVRAQEANQGQLGGHGERAKQLLREAANELRAAATVLNQEGR